MQTNTSDYAFYHELYLEQDSGLHDMELRLYRSPYILGKMSFKELFEQSRTDVGFHEQLSEFIFITFSQFILTNDIQTSDVQKQHSDVIAEVLRTHTISIEDFEKVLQAFIPANKPGALLIRKPFEYRMLASLLFNLSIPASKRKKYLRQTRKLYQKDCGGILVEQNAHLNKFVDTVIEMNEELPNDEKLFDDIADIGGAR